MVKEEIEKLEGRISGARSDGQNIAFGLIAVAHAVADYADVIRQAQVQAKEMMDKQLRKREEEAG